MSRKGAGTILLVGFAIMVIILTISAYIAPPSVRVETIVQEDFVDTLSYMTTVMETASRLPGTTEDKINFINRSFSALGRNLAEKGIYFVFTNITMPLEGGNGENIVVIYTLSKEDSYFVGLLATNLTDLQEGIGSGSGGGSPPPGGGDQSEECVPIKTFPAFIVLYLGHHDDCPPDHHDDCPPDHRPLPCDLGMIRLYLLNLQPEDYNLTMDLEVFSTHFYTKRGIYINFQPLYINVFDSIEEEEFYISAREHGITGLAFLQVKLLPPLLDPGGGYLIITPNATPESECSGISEIRIYVTDDWETYRELLIQAIREGMHNLIEWIRAGSGG